MEYLVRGKIWKFGRDVDTDQIIPAERLTTGEPKELARYAFEKVRPEFTEYVNKFLDSEIKNYKNIIVADENFGCGSSREHAPRALIGVPIGCVVAKSFARIFFRNSINIGLPLVESDLYFDEDDAAEINFNEGIIKNETKGTQKSFKPYPPFLQDLIAEAGLKEYTKRKVRERELAKAQP